MASRSSGGRRKVRQDRLVRLCVAAAAVLLVLIIIINSVLSLKNKSRPDDDTGVSSTVKTSKLEFEIKYVNSSDISKGNLILVNDSHVFSGAEQAESESFTGIDSLRSDYYSIKNVSMKMDTLALKNFNAMMNGFFKETGKTDIMITEAFVSVNSQNTIYNLALENSKYESRGGYSEHQTGLAVDLGIYPDDDRSFRYVPSGDYAWIRDNCVKYGFVQRYQDDKASVTGIRDHSEHFRYVGIPHAWYMTNNNLCLEEYLQELKKYTYGNKTLSFSCFDKSYEIYYIRSKDGESGNSEIYVPVNAQYSVSGNNADGFIVTIEK